MTDSYRDRVKRAAERAEKDVGSGVRIPGAHSQDSSTLYEDEVPMFDEAPEFDKEPKKEAEEELSPMEKERAFERKLAESLPELNLDQLLSDSRVSQRVPVLGGKLEVVFESLTGEDTEFINKYVFELEESKVGAGYGQDRMVLLTLALSVRGMKGQAFPSVREGGTPKSELVEKKISILKGYNADLLNLLSKHYGYFARRVAALFDETEVKKD